MSKYATAIYKAASTALPKFHENNWYYGMDESPVTHGDLRACLWELVDAARSMRADGKLTLGEEISTGRFLIKVLDVEKLDVAIYFMGEEVRLGLENPGELDPALLVATASDEAMELELLRKRQFARELAAQPEPEDPNAKLLRFLYIKQYGDDDVQP